MAVGIINKVETRSGWPRRFSPVWLPLLSLIFFVVLTALLLWPLTAHLATSVNNEGDDLQQMWSMGWVIHSLTHDPANLFNANIFYPYPNTLAYSDNLIPQALQALPVYLVTGNLILSYNLVLFGSFVLSGWGMFWLVRSLTRSNAAGLFSGTIFAFAPYKIAHLSQLNLLSIQWLPFVFLCLHQLIVSDLNYRKKNQPINFLMRLRFNWGWFIGFGFFFLLQSLSSTYYFLFALPLYLLYFVGFYLFEKSWPSPVVLIKLVAVGVVAGLIILPTLLPYIQVSNSQSAERTVREVDQFSANYRYYFGVPDNNLFWGSTLARFGGSGGERRLFPGALAYLFALVAMLFPLILSLLKRFSKKPALQTDDVPVESGSTFVSGFKPSRYLYIILGLFALLMSFGFTLHVKGLDIGLPYRVFYAYFPGWKGLRAAVRYGVFVLFAVSVLAGFGLVYVQNLLNNRALKKRLSYGSTGSADSTGRVSKFLPISLIGLLLLATFWEYRSDLTFTRPDVLTQPPAVYTWLAAPERAGPVIELPMATGPDLPSIHDFYSTLNWLPTVNGESGYTPPVYSDLVSATKPDTILSPQTISTLQGMGVRWLVWNLHDESMPLDQSQWQKLQPKLDSTPVLKLAYNSPDYRVYELMPDPWMSKVSQIIPDKDGLYISDFRRQQPFMIELAATILQRNHPIYGNDRAGYRFLHPAPTGQPISFGLFATNEDPTPYGFKPDEVVWNNAWLKLYKRKANLLAAYDTTHDPALQAYNHLTDELQIRQEVEGVRLADKQILGNGQRLLGQSQIQLTFASLINQTISLILTDGSVEKVNLVPGLNVWRSGPLEPNKTKRDQVLTSNVIKIEPNKGQDLYLSRVESLEWQQGNPTGLIGQPRAAILQTTTHQDGNQFVSSLRVFVPGDSNSHYNLTLDVYKRPWGSATSGHFGNWTVALTGQNSPQTIELRFDPLTHQTTATLDKQPANLGAQPIDTRDNPYTAYISLTQLDGQTATFFGVSPLFDFTLDSGKISEVNIKAGSDLIFTPPLK